MNKNKGGNQEKQMKCWRGSGGGGERGRMNGTDETCMAIMRAFISESKVADWSHT